MAKEKDKPESTVDPVAVAREAIDADKKQRSDACARELQDLLKRHGCRIVPQVVIHGNQVGSDVLVVAD